MLLAAALALVLGFQYYSVNYSDKGILDNVTERRGYTLQRMKDQVPVQFFIEPEWISFKSGEQKTVNIKLLETNNTNIMLDNVWNRGNDIYFSFHVTFTNLNRNSGTFLYNGIFNEDGTFTSVTPWKENLSLVSKTGQMIDPGQTGGGPGSDFSFGINIGQQQLLRGGITITYSGFYLYQYNRMQTALPRHRAANGHF